MVGRFFSFWMICLFGSVLVQHGLAPVCHAEALTLREPATDSRTFDIQVQVKAQGTLKTPVKEDAAANLPLELQATLNYVERRLPAAGRDDRAWRSLRKYSQARSRIVVKEQPTQLELTKNIQEVVVEGQRSGLMLYSPGLPLQRKDVDLLNLPGDPLTMLASLPSRDVEVGDSWTVPQWAAQMFAGVEAVTSAQLTGKLLAVNDQIAEIQITGEVKGATTGASTQVTLNGTAQFDLKQKLLQSLKLIQKEERGISTVSPGMSVTATIHWTRKPAAQSAAFSQDQLDEVPLDAPPTAQMLAFQSKHWNLNLMHDRNWHVFQEIPEVTVLRLVESGSLISQCNIARIPSMRPGEHVAAEKFERDIKISLGDQLSQIVDSQEVPSDQGHFIYRVVAAGTAHGLEMVWIYFLCAHPDGRQVSFVFAVEQDNLEVLNSRDLAIVDSLTFEPAP